MAAGDEPLLEKNTDARPTWKTRCGKVGGKLCGVLVALVIILQLLCSWWATMGCSAGRLQKYKFPGGSAPAAENLVPRNSMLTQQPPRWFGASFMVLPADDHALISGASTGVYFRTWGPLWYTYVYQDALGAKTFAVRKKFFSVGSSYLFQRCDGAGNNFVMNEGKHYLMNEVRRFFGMYTGTEYNIWDGSKLVAISTSLGGGPAAQLNFRSLTSDTPFASAILHERHYHGHLDQWFVHQLTKEVIPDWVTNGAAAVTAFYAADLKAKTSNVKKGEAAKTPSFLLAIDPALSGNESESVTAENHVNERQHDEARRKVWRNDTEILAKEQQEDDEARGGAWRKDDANNTMQVNGTLAEQHV